MLEELESNGLRIAPLPGSAKVTITVPSVEAESEADAKAVAVSRVRRMLPPEGYTVSNPELRGDEERIPAGVGERPS